MNKASQTHKQTNNYKIPFITNSPIQIIINKNFNDNINSNKFKGISPPSVLFVYLFFQILFLYIFFKFPIHSHSNDLKSIIVHDQLPSRTIVFFTITTIEFRGDANNNDQQL